MESLLSSLKQYYVRFKAVLVFTIRTMSLRQKTIFAGLFLVFLISSIAILAVINDSLMVTVAAPGGNLSEGVIGSPRYINPLLAVSDADRDLTALVYSGLMRPGPDGHLVADLAERWSLSEDGKTYTFILRPNLEWHDGTPLTTDDIEFTVHKAQEPGIKSPKRASWEGVAVQKINEREINFILKQPYALFLENTTLGVVPKHLWNNVSAEAFSLHELNIRAVGSGPYAIDSIETDDNGVPSRYTLKPFAKFALGRAKIKKLTLQFYPTADKLLEAFERGEIKSMSALSPILADKARAHRGTTIIKQPLPRIFAVFFNTSQSAALADHLVREALDSALDKEAIIKNALSGYAAPINGPLPPLENLPTATTSASSSIPKDPKTILAQAGWEPGEDGILRKTSSKGTVVLRFTVATSDIPELKAVGELVVQSWQALGADVELKVYEIGDLNQNVIRPRKYEALLFGEILGREPDPFPFWHSSQRLDPGLNVALYANSATDKLLEEARATADSGERGQLYARFAETLGQDHPAAFLYAPYFLYALPESMSGVDLPVITTPAERFATIHRWYATTDRVWKIFANQNNIINKP